MRFYPRLPTGAPRARLVGVALAGALALGPAHAHLGDYPFRVVAEEAHDGQRLVAINDGPAPVSLRFAVAGENLGLDRPARQRLVVPPRTRVTLLRAFAFDPRRSYRIEQQIVFRVGDERTTPDGAPLRLPFADGQSAVVAPPAARAQAVRFALPEGAGVVASRPGRIIDIDDDAVVVLHSDGTYARYGDFIPGPELRLGQELASSAPLGTAKEQPLEVAAQRTLSSPEGPTAQALALTFQAFRPALALALKPGETVTADYANPYVPPAPAPEAGKVDVQVAPGRPVDLDRETVRRAFETQFGRAPVAQQAPERSPAVFTAVTSVAREARAAWARLDGFVRNPPQLGKVGLLLAALTPVLAAAVILGVMLHRQRRLTG